MLYLRAFALRLCTLALLGVGFSSSISAQDLPPSKKAPTAESKETKVEKEEKPETIYNLKVQAKGESKPALKYQLLPELAEMNPGNAIQNYLKAFSEQSNYFFNKEVLEKREKWLNMPLKDLGGEELRNLVRTSISPMKMADYAARQLTCEWDILYWLKKEGIYCLLPDIQQMRNLANWIRLRLRLDIKEQRYDDAIVTCKTLFALAQHCGEHPTLIGQLVGIALAHNAQELLLEMIEQPGSPNLYWAIEFLPKPFISMNRGMQGERYFVEATFGDTYKKTTPLSKEEIDVLIEKLAKIEKEMLGQVPAEKRPKKSLIQAMVSRSEDEKAVAAARKVLLEQGVPADRVQKLPGFQVIYLHDIREFENLRDDALKIFHLPFWEVEKRAKANPIGNDFAIGSGSQNLFVEFLPAIYNVRRAQVRLEQRFALIQTIEAIRLYAADHDGALPAKLDQISVPVPMDPISGKPFLYSVQDGIATIDATAPKGMEKNGAFKFKVKLQITKS